MVAVYGLCWDEGVYEGRDADMMDADGCFGGKTKDEEETKK